MTQGKNIWSITGNYGKWSNIREGLQQVAHLKIFNGYRPKIKLKRESVRIFGFQGVTGNYANWIHIHPLVCSWILARLPMKQVSKISWYPSTKNKNSRVYVGGYFRLWKRSRRMWWIIWYLYKLTWIHFRITFYILIWHWKMRSIFIYVNLFMRSWENSGNGN